MEKNKSRVLHKHLPACPGQVKVEVGQVFLNKDINYLPELGKDKFSIIKITFT